MTVAPNYPVEYLHQGSMILTRKSLIIQTLLGSCIGVTGYSAETGWAGMIHTLLPAEKEASAHDSLLYTDKALQILVRELRQKAGSGQLVFQVYGGGSVIQMEGSVQKSIGQQNIEAVFEQMRQLNIVPAFVDTGGNWGRRIQFQTWDGHVTVKRVCTYDPEPCREV